MHKTININIKSEKKNTIFFAQTIFKLDGVCIFASLIPSVKKSLFRLRGRIQV